MLTKKDVSQREYDAWAVKWQEAERTIVDREETIMKVAAEIETDMTLVGSTAIEDRLQDNVEETIISLKDAGIRIWVLTGDKVETAIQIGFSTGLINDQMGQFIIDGVSFSEVSMQLVKVADVIHEAKLMGKLETQKNALILAGDSLTLICT
jgi:magnesium-transporting ATPase (P-type)